MSIRGKPEGSMPTNFSIGEASLRLQSNRAVPLQQKTTTTPSPADFFFKILKTTKKNLLTTSKPTQSIITTKVKANGKKSGTQKDNTRKNKPRRLSQTLSKGKGSYKNIVRSSSSAPAHLNNSEIVSVGNMAPNNTSLIEIKSMSLAEEVEVKSVSANTTTGAPSAFP